ncbi:putative mediator of RNA polymerase II transcription subunit 26 [Anastrepha ludens]|uniref:putative mediator of RNA polymerase II transcription subunit 26 n=1 Tax=Anastrepha ludens TaxID=28586 RepID=UPI0023AEAB8F|nr:putative mediator of RNA polymerase II transcription subunit 26 [Anastrepha ludens]
MGLTYKALKYRDVKMNLTKAKAGGGGGGGDVSDVSADSVYGEGSEQQVSALAIEASTSLMDATTAAATEKQQHFTADHIMQLCLFLAEKSRAKQLQQNQEMNARRYYENFLKEATDFVEDEKMRGDNESSLPQTRPPSASYKLKSTQIKHNISTTTLHQTSPRAARRTKIKSEKILKQAVLTDTFSTSSSNNQTTSLNSLPEFYEKLTQNAHNYQQSPQHQQHQQHQQQDKRDILRKIREQIFERKRLRQVLSGSQQQLGSEYLQPQCHQQPAGSDYSSVELQQQDELQQLADVWRPW